MSAPAASPANVMSYGPRGAALEGVTCDTLGDHRLTVGPAVVGLARAGADVIEPHCAVASRLELRQHLQQVGGSVEGVVPA